MVDPLRWDDAPAREAADDSDGPPRSKRPVPARPSPSVAQVLANIAGLRRRLQPESRLLIVGGGVLGHGIGELVADPAVEVYAFDVYSSPEVQFIADGHQMPFGDGSFDAVVIQAVLEHVLDPRQVVGEIERVLRDGGLVYAETAFMQHVHEGAHDYVRFTERGHRWLFRNFTRIDSGPIGGPALQLVWSLDYLVRGLTGRRRAGLIVRRLFAPLERLDRLVRLGHRIDAAPAVYFMGSIRRGAALSEKQLNDGYSGAE